MKLDKSLIGWALAGTFALIALLCLALELQPRRTPNEATAVRSKMIELVEQIRFALASAAEAEKSAVLANTDQDSNLYAQRARSSTAEVERWRGALGELVQSDGTAKEKELLAQFSTAFVEYQRVDRELLDLAVRNTNVKATALAFGAGASAMKEMDGALKRILVRASSSRAADARQIMASAAYAEAAGLRIQALLPVHIAEESDQKMDALELAMAAEDREASTNLDALGRLLAPGDADLALAKAKYDEYKKTKSEILKLSRANTNVRSLSISLNEKRKITTVCQDALEALEKVIGETQVERHPPRL